jgi:TRAP-type C4-dicarboxylate transport system permease small subunit
MKGFKKVYQVVETVSRVFYYIGAVALCLLFLGIFADLAYRFLFSTTIDGVIEVCEILMVTIAFMALGYGQLIGAHVKMEYFGELLYKRHKPYIDVVTTLIVIAFFGVMTVQVGKRAYLDWAGKVLLTNTTVPLPVWWHSAIGAAGTGMLVICLLVQLIGLIIGIVGSYLHHREFIREGA